MNDDEGDRGQCFSCGFSGHGMNRCTRLDRSFPYITPGLSANLRDGEYRASKLTGEAHIPTRGKEGWTISNNNMTDPGGGRSPAWKRPKDDTYGPGWTSDVQSFPVLGSLTPAEKDRRDRAIQKCAAVVDKDAELDPLCRPEGGGSHWAPLVRLTKTPRRQMRPAGNGELTRRMTSARRNNAGMRSAALHILVEVVDFSPAPAQAWNEEAGRKTKSSRTGGIGPMAVVKPPLPTAGGGGGGG